MVAVGAADEFACYFAAGFVAAPTAGLGGAAVAAECTAVGFTGGSGTEQLTGRGSPHRSHRPGGVGYSVHAVPTSRGEAMEMARGSSIDGGGHLALIALGIAVVCFIIAAVASRRKRRR